MFRLVTLFFTTWLFSAWLLTGCSDSGLPLLSGERLEVEPDGKEWTLINYWATWCSPCREEIPELNKVHVENDIRVIGVNFDQLTGNALQAAVDEMGIRFEVALDDPRRLWPYEIPQALPATLVIAPGGEVKATLLGPQTEASLREAMR